MARIGDTFVECDICGHVYDTDNHESCSKNVKKRKHLLIYIIKL